MWLAIIFVLVAALWGGMSVYNEDDAAISPGIEYSAQSQIQAQRLMLLHHEALRYVTENRSAQLPAPGDADRVWGAGQFTALSTRNSKLLYLSQDRHELSENWGVVVADDGLVATFTRTARGVDAQEIAHAVKRASYGDAAVGVSEAGFLRTRVVRGYTGSSSPGTQYNFKSGYGEVQIPLPAGVPDNVAVIIADLRP